MSDPLARQDRAGDDFTFFVGPRAHEYTIHGPTFARLSEPMNRLILGGFKEDDEKRAEWPDVAPQTFEMLRQFTHEADYSVQNLFPVTPDHGLDIEIVYVQSRHQDRRAIAHEISVMNHAGPLSPRARQSSSNLILDVYHEKVIEAQSNDLPNRTEACSCVSEPFSCEERAPNEASLLRHIRLSHAERQIRALEQCRPDLESVELMYDRNGERIRGFTRFKAHFDEFEHLMKASSEIGHISRQTANPSEDTRENEAKDTGQRVAAVSASRSSSKCAAPFCAAASKYAPSDETDASFTHCLLAHTDVYILAQEKLIIPLKLLALSKIHWILTRFTPDHARLPTLIKFARRVFENTFGADGLRLLVAEYLALYCRKDNVGVSSEFVQLMEEGGDLAGHIWKQVFWRRLA